MEYCEERPYPLDMRQESLTVAVKNFRVRTPIHEHVKCSIEQVNMWFDKLCACMASYVNVRTTCFRSNLRLSANASENGLKLFTL